VVFLDIQAQPMTYRLGSVLQRPVPARRGCVTPSHVQCSCSQTNQPQSAEAKRDKREDTMERKYGDRVSKYTRYRNS